MIEGDRRRPPTWWVVAHVLIFTCVPFAAAAWVLLVSSQPAAIKLFAATVVAFAGLWNLWRVRDKWFR